MEKSNFRLFLGYVLITLNRKVSSCSQDKRGRYITFGCFHVRFGSRGNLSCVWGEVPY